MNEIGKWKMSNVRKHTFRARYVFTEPKLADPLNTISSEKHEDANGYRGFPHSNQVNTPN